MALGHLSDVTRTILDYLALIEGDDGDGRREAVESEEAMGQERMLVSDHEDGHDRTVTLELRRKTLDLLLTQLRQVRAVTARLGSCRSPMPGVP